MALNWQTVTLPLAAGLQQQADARAGNPPKLDICRDVQFDEEGGVQTRYPFAAMSNNIFGGGTLSGCRRLAVVNDELCVFTSDSLYSWNAQLAAWVLRGTHLAVNVTETPRFVTTGDQIDGDEAELAGTIVQAWTEGGVVFAAASDKATGAVLMSPTSLIASSSRPRLIALDTKIVLFIESGGALVAIALDPANPATAISGGPTVTVLAAGTFNLFYDVAKVDGQNLVVGAARRVTTTSYTVFTVTSTLTVTAVTKARTADGPLAVSSVPGGGLQTQVIRGNGTNIQGDFLTTSTLADVTTGQAVGTGTGTINQIAACHRSVTTGGAFRCYAFWSSSENAGFSSGFASKFNFVDTAGAIGTQANFVLGLGVGSRAFSYNGSVYVWMAFGRSSTFQGDVALVNQTQAQNAYLLYRDDQFLVAKAAYNVGAGHRSTTGFLPGVALTGGSSTFSWIGTYRRRLLLGGGSTAFAARASRDITFSFDSNEARRCAFVGRTMYCAAGEVLQYDGTRLVECGFHVYPFSFDMLKSGTGSVPTGSFAYKLTWRYTNGQGESERSTTATIGLATMTGGPAGFAMGSAASLTPTHKALTNGAVAIEVWRTVVNSTADSPFFLASNPDPTLTTAPNQYIANVPTVAFAPAAGTWRDEMTDAVLTTKEANPENGTVLESLCPPGASIIIATDTRVYLAGIAGQPDSVWYSRLRNDGEIVSFHDGNVIPVPRVGGDVTALVFNAETLTAFRSTAIYALLGQGFDNAGGGQNFEARIISHDVGAVSQESVAFTPRGVIFRSRKGWYLLSPSWQVQYIGGPVTLFDGDTVLSIDVVETQHHVRILTNNRMLVWDYLAVTQESPLGQWGEWTITDGLHSVIWNGSHVYLTATGPKLQQTTYSGLTYGDDVETAWWKPADQQGEATIRWFSVLGEYRSACMLRVRVARDYLYDGAGNAVYYDDTAWLVSPTTVGSALQVKHTPSRQIVQAIKVRLTAVTAGTSATIATVASLAITTSGTVWTATLRARLAGADAPGEMGNAYRLAISVIDGTPFAISVRDHYRYIGGRWTEALNTIGVLITCRTGSSPTVANLEAAITAATNLAQVTVADPSPSKVINASALAGAEQIGSFTGGVYGIPTGEAVKLTGIAFEVGLHQGLNKRLSAAQKAG